MYEQLVYISRAMPDLNAKGAYDIIRVSHNRNSKYGLTGTLILLDGYFLQVLEGHRHALRERFAIIEVGPRHTDISVRHSITMSERGFPNEWMALRHGDAVEEHLKLDFGYLPGFPETHFGGEKLVEFALACYHPYRKTQPGSL